MVQGSGRRSGIALRAGAALVVLAACGGGAGPDLQASCLASPRSPGSAACSCAAGLADQALTARDREIAAEIIREPDLFLDYQRSDDPRREAFVARYRAWGEAVAVLCEA